MGARVMAPRSFHAAIFYPRFIESRGKLITEDHLSFLILLPARCRFWHGSALFMVEFPE